MIGRIIIRAKPGAGRENKALSGKDFVVFLVADDGVETLLPVRSLMVSVMGVSSRVRVVLDIDASAIEIDGQVELALRKTIGDGDVDAKFDDEASGG